ncbi:glycosyltransferase [Evansella sp. LMS18]|uniref:glycosyltransferase family 2 protein n=1 Tax=Evansella sp. LMS18 TaxID=2924033 RepID=UPI0020D1E595|nr:glycosyltransferase family 2 protein [Evansella sp. LMS18]UTR11812.1 glycosyltransferase [Evansella sp. LMS18]
MNNEQEKNFNELVSVITPAYNAEKFIHNTIKSVLAQTYSKWEMIVVDDCSTDSTVKIVREYMQQDERIKLIQLKKNSGPAVTRNTAIKNARGRYLAFLDSDDQWYPEKLEKQLKYMEENKIAFSFSSYEYMDEKGNPSGKTEPVPELVNYKDLLKQNMIGCLTVMLDTEKTGNIEMVNIRSRQDYTTWLNLTKRGIHAYGLQEVLARYRVVENSLSSNKFKMAKQNWKVYREIENLGLIKSIYYFIYYLFNKFKKYVL